MTCCCSPYIHYYNEKLTTFELFYVSIPNAPSFKRQIVRKNSSSILEQRFFVKLYLLSKQTSNSRVPFL